MIQFLHIGGWPVVLGWRLLICVLIASGWFASQARADEVDAFFFMTTMAAYTTFGPTTTTSELTNASDVREARVRERAFVERNYDAMVEEIAKGGGEAMSSFYGLLACTDAAKPELDTLNRRLQEDASFILPTARDPDELRRKIKTRMRQQFIDGVYGLWKECRWVRKDMDTHDFIKN